MVVVKQVIYMLLIYHVAFFLQQRHGGVTCKESVLETAELHSPHPPNVSWTVHMNGMLLKLHCMSLSFPSLTAEISYQSKRLAGLSVAYFALAHAALLLSVNE